MLTAEIRSAYLEFFGARDHKVVPSSSLVPGNDPTLLFTNAGMVQFKDALTGRERLDYTRATSCQRCVRAGGKHNDLENVGHTARHHTLFEMLGNFSFGDYFKEEAIDWAWEFVREVLAWPRDRLWVTVHPTDDEARRLWIDKIGMPAGRVIDHEENFWAMGDTGPCGPNTEIFYDQGPAVAGGPPGSPEEDGDRFLEFWNLVFPQFDRSPDGALEPLASPGIDTGMGLERTAAIDQGVLTNFEADVFRGVIARAAGMAGIRDAASIAGNVSLRVIADHIRAASFLIADGVLPSNEDRGYVLRRIVRRALRHGHQLDLREPFFHGLVAPLAEEMGAAYPLLEERRASIEAVLLGEEERFARTLDRGMVLLGRTIADLSGDTIPGAVAFELYDTYGFPVDLTADVARERGLRVDMAGFEAVMETQRARSREASRFDASEEQQVRVESNVRFEGYESLANPANVVALFRTGEGAPEETSRLDAGEFGLVALDRTPFYAEAGGQVGDTGEIGADGVRFEVQDTTRGGGQHLHRGRLAEGALEVGQEVTANVDGARRRDIVLNHSATHLLHKALRGVLGPHVQQKGSLVAPDRLRFDFSHPAPVSADELRRIESEVNTRIRENSPATTEIMPFAEAMERGAIALFGEKYGDEVRVLTLGDGYSVELCGGTHVRRTGDIGLMHIVSESGIAAGVRRIEAVTGRGALAWVEESERLIADIAEVVRAGRGELADKVQALSGQARALAKELETARTKLAQSEGSSLANRAVEVDGVRVLGAEVPGDAKTLLTTLDSLKDKLGRAVIVLGQVHDGRVNLIAGVTKNLTDRFQAGEVIGFVGEQVGARGGGRPDMARAGGGTRPEALGDALASVAHWVEERSA